MKIKRQVKIEKERGMNDKVVRGVELPRQHLTTHVFHADAFHHAVVSANKQLQKKQ